MYFIPSPNNNTDGYLMNYIRTLEKNSTREHTEDVPLKSDVTNNNRIVPQDESEAQSKKRRNMPSKESPGRKRIKNPNTWKKNVLKQKVNSGQEYKNKRNKTVRKREMKMACSEKCYKKCRTKISEDQRLKLFERFWSLDSHSKKSIFLSKWVTRIPKKRVKNQAESRRKSSLQYSLPLSSNETLPVCKKMFLNTLDITDQWVNVICT